MERYTAWTSIRLIPMAYDSFQPLAVGIGNRLTENLSWPADLLHNSASTTFGCYIRMESLYVFDPNRPPYFTVTNWETYLISGRLMDGIGHQRLRRWLSLDMPTSQL